MYKVNLTAARVNAGFTLEEAAKEIGKGKSTLISWEKGKTAIDVYSLDRLCNLYNVPKENIFLPDYSTISSIKQENNE